MFKQVLKAAELVARLIEIRQGKNIPLGADRIYTCECVAKEYARNHSVVAKEAAEIILAKTDELIAETGIPPHGIAVIFSLLTGSSAGFPYKEVCVRHGYAA